VYEAFLAVLLFGICLGGILSQVRGAYNLMIPKSRESELWTFFAISSKMLSWLGPLTVIFINESYCDFRLALLSVMLWLLLGALLLVFVDFQKVINSLGLFFLFFF
jgi:UMF1 family MFS transporter